MTLDETKSAWILWCQKNEIKAKTKMKTAFTCKRFIYPLPQCVYFYPFSPLVNAYFCVPHRLLFCFPILAILPSTLTHPLFTIILISCIQFLDRSTASKCFSFCVFENQSILFWVYVFAFYNRVMVSVLYSLYITRIYNLDMCCVGTWSAYFLCISSVHLCACVCVCVGVCFASYLFKRSMLKVWIENRHTSDIDKYNGEKMVWWT